MKRYLLRAVLILSVLTVAVAAGSRLLKLERVPKPIQVSDGSGPIPTCRPGTTCGPDDQVRQMADGSGPIPTCRPGTTCGPDDQLRLTITQVDGYYAEVYAG